MELYTQLLDDMLDGYITCALWSSTDESTESGGYPLDDNYSEDDIAEEALADMRIECSDFLAEAAPYLANRPAHVTGNQIGHDFWLTRNHHGAGFWDRPSYWYPADPNGELTKISHAAGSRDLYVGDDGKIHQS